MKICIVGLPLSGKSALFSALTGASTEAAAAKGPDPIAECRTEGTLRLEGKAYPVRDGDIINFRFAV